jgi:hypothetical protein
MSTLMHGRDSVHFIDLVEGDDPTLFAHVVNTKSLQDEKLGFRGSQGRIMESVFILGIFWGEIPPKSFNFPLPENFLNWI